MRAGTVRTTIYILRDTLPTPRTNSSFSGVRTISTNILVPFVRLHYRVSLPKEMNEKIASLVRSSWCSTPHFVAKKWRKPPPIETLHILVDCAPNTAFQNFSFGTNNDIMTLYSVFAKETKKSMYVCTREQNPRIPVFFCHFIFGRKKPHFEAQHQ